MANIFKKEQGQFSRVLPPVLTQGQNFYNTNTGANEGIVNFSTETGQRLLPGQTTPLQQPSPTRTLDTPTPSPYTQPNAPQTPTPQPNQKTDPYTAFNLLLQDALKKAQGLDNTENLKQQRSLSREAITRGQGDGIGSISTEERKFLSPGQQNSMRGADVGALSSDIDEVQYQITKTNQDRQNLLEQISQAREMGNTLQNKEYQKVQDALDEAYRQATLAESKRSNLASERIAGIKAIRDTPTSSYKSELATTGRQAIKGLLDIATANKGIFSRTAALPLPDALRSDAYRNYNAQLEYLKGNIIPAALSAMREASKTGGALGQVSDREGAWLASSLGALSMSQDPETVIKQLGLIDESFKRWQGAVEQYGTGESSGDLEYDAYLKTINQ